MAGGTSRKALVLAIALVLALAGLIIGDRIEQNRAATSQPETGVGKPAGPTTDEPAPETTKAVAPDPPPDPIPELLAGAREDFEARRLSSPPGRNAVEKLHRILELDPDHPDALGALRAVVERYLGLVEEAVAEGDHERAIALAAQAGEVVASHDSLSDLRRPVALRELVARGRAAAKGGDMKSAQRYLNRALEIAPDNPELRRYKKRLEAAKAKRQRARSRD